MYPNTTHHTAICPFCGTERSYTETTEDSGHVHTYGHDRYRTRSTDSGCSCEAWHLYNKDKRINIRGCCVNCVFNEFGRCTCQEKIQSLSEHFEINGTLTLKDQTRVCEYYEFDERIAMMFINLEVQTIHSEASKSENKNQSKIWLKDGTNEE